jgi:hypothetical protein
MKLALILLSLLPLLALASRVEFGHSDQTALSPSAFEEGVSVIVIFRGGATQITAASHLKWLDEIYQKHESMKFELRRRSQIQDGHDRFEGLEYTYDIGGTIRGYSGHFDVHIVEQIGRHPDVRLLPSLRS